MSALAKNGHQVRKSEKWPKTDIVAKQLKCQAGCTDRDLSSFQIFPSV